MVCRRVFAAFAQRLAYAEAVCETISLHFGGRFRRVAQWLVCAKVSAFQQGGHSGGGCSRDLAEHALRLRNGWLMQKPERPARGNPDQVNTELDYNQE